MRVRGTHTLILALAISACAPDEPDVERKFQLITEQEADEGQTLRHLADRQRAFMQAMTRGGDEAATFMELWFRMTDSDAPESMVRSKLKPVPPGRDYFQTLATFPRSDLSAGRIAPRLLSDEMAVVIAYPESGKPFITHWALHGTEWYVTWLHIHATPDALHAYEQLKITQR